MNTDEQPTGNAENVAENSDSFQHYIAPLLLLTSIFFVNFISRILQAPLMPEIEKELGLSHAAAGSLFLSLSSGYFITLIGSGFFTARLKHRGTIILSVLALSLALIATSFSQGLMGIRIGLICLGLAAGLYLPSGIATLTSLVSPKHWGKALALHELAPNLSFMAAPLMAEAIILQFSWRAAFLMLGLVALILGLVYVRFGRGGEFAGEPPSPRAIRALVSVPTFWVMIALFSLGVCGTLGVYTMLPLYLVTEVGFEREFANTLVAISRVSTIGMAFVGGWANDRFGSKKTLGVVFLLSGSLTLLLGISPRAWIYVILLLQPMVAVCFFPAGLAVLSTIGPPNARNLTISLTTPFAFLLGGGVVPTLIGFIGDTWSFSAGISLVGGFILCGALLTRLLK